MSLILMLAASSAYAQSGPDAAPTAPPRTSSPLNGNWNITGNRQKMQFPLISMFIQLNGRQINGQGDVHVMCPDAPKNGGGGDRSMGGELAADGSFSLTTLNPNSRVKVTVKGKAPLAGATTWSGEYTVVGNPYLRCATDRQANTFTATALAPLSGTFSGSTTMEYSYADPPPPSYTGPVTYKASFSISAKQGDPLVAHITKRGPVYYLPVTGAINVKGASCFSHGTAEAGLYSTIEGDIVHLRFGMDDGSQLNVSAVYTDPSESGISLSSARVTGGKCDRQFFHGELDRQ